uniref:Uncharacterized protein n=1 Tax=Anguilla anguilla TaxID=7936 RepID=A0A0E9WAF6_ANGAN
MEGHTALQLLPASTVFFNLQLVHLLPTQSNVLTFSSPNQDKKRCIPF